MYLNSRAEISGAEPFCLLLVDSNVTSILTWRSLSCNTAFRLLMLRYTLLLKALSTSGVVTNLASCSPQVAHIAGVSKCWYRSTTVIRVNPPPAKKPFHRPPCWPRFSRSPHPGQRLLRLPGKYSSYAADR